MRRALPIAIAFPLGIALAACPAKGPKVPAACTAITEDNDPAEDHCSKDEADCEKTLSDILHKAHANRCPMPPCTAYSAYVDCTPTGDECELGDGSWGQRFTTSEQIRCR
jgi:hypothetical protein